MANKNKKQLRTAAALMLLLALIQKLFLENANESMLQFACFETTVLCLIILVIHIKWLGSFLKVSVLFSLMYFLYMFGQIGLYSIGCLEGQLFDGKFSINEIYNGIIKAQVFFSLFTIGLTSVNSSIENFHAEPLIEDNIDTKTRRIAYWLIILSAPFEVYVLGTKLIYSLMFGYASLFQETALNSIPSSYKILANFFMSGVFLLSFASARYSKHEKLAFVLLLAHAIGNMAIGYRGYAMAPLILLLYIISVKNRSLPIIVRKKQNSRILLLCLTLLVVVVFIFPAIQLNRNSGGLSSSSIEEMFSLRGNALFETVREMGKSLQTVIHTDNLVPETYPFRYGYTYLMNISTALPNLFWSRHPAEIYGSLGRWVTSIVDPEFYEFGGAIGFSCVAESYINFGWIGLIIIPLLMGNILRTYENKVDKSRSALNYACFAIVSLPLIAYYSRGELSDLIRPLFWYMLIPRLIILK